MVIMSCKDVKYQAIGFVKRGLGNKFCVKRTITPTFFFFLKYMLKTAIYEKNQFCPLGIRRNSFVSLSKRNRL
jgi:hypothetical protein